MEEDNIRIKIKSINNEEHELCVKQSMNTEELKSILAEKKNVNKSDIRLIYQGQCLSNEKTISDYNIQNDHIIHLVIRKRDNANNNGDNKCDNINTSTNTNRINDNMNDPLNMNFATSMNHNNSSSTNTTNTASPFYFTHMRLTRNDNLENDLMGQNNIYSLLNDIMSQVNINPSFIYGAAAAANDNIFANSMNPNMNDYSNKGKENKKNEDENINKESSIKKDEDKRQKVKNTCSDKKNYDNTNLDADQKKDREKKGKGKINEKKEEDKNREKKKIKENKIEKGGQYEEGDGEECKEKDRKEEEKEIKKKKKRKNINEEKKKYKNKNREENKGYPSDDSGSSSYNESYSSNSKLSESDDSEEEKEQKKKHEQKIKKKRSKNKYKKKKYYDYSSFTSEEEPFKKDERMRKQNENIFEEHYYYPPNYFCNNNNILKKKNEFSKCSYPFIGNTLKSSYNEKQQKYNYRDDFNDIYENINDNRIDDYLKKRERKKKMFNDYNKNMFYPTKRNANNVIDNNPSNKNGPGSKSMLGLSNILKNSNDCVSGGRDDCYYTKNTYSNIVPLSDTERNNELIRNDSFRTNSRIVVNEPVALSSNNSLSGNMRSIQMSSNRRPSTLRRSEPKCLNNVGDPEYKNVEINIPWRVIEQLLVLLEEETGYRRPDLSSYIHSYYNSNSIYVFFYLFVHINNIINSIIIQFNHANFLNNDITMSSFSRISLILSLASVIFSKLSNFFFVFYDNFYFPNYANNYRNPGSINHEFLREIRNLYYSNNRNSNINNNRMYHNNHHNNNAYMNMDLYNQNSYPNNANNDYCSLPYDMRNNYCNKTYLQQEFEDYYKNYLPYVKDNKNMILRKDNFNNNKENNINQHNSPKEDNTTNTGKMSTNNKFCNKSVNENNDINNIFLKSDKIKEHNESNNNSFLNFSNKNKSLTNNLKKKRTDEKEKEKKKHHKHNNENYLFKDVDSYKSKSSGSNSDSSNYNNKRNNFSSGFNSNALNIKEKKESILDKFQSSLKNTNGEKIKETNNNKNFLNENNLNNNVEKANDKKNTLNNILNNNLIFYDSNIDDIYDVSEDGKEKGSLVEKKEEIEINKNVDNAKKGKLYNNAIKEKTETVPESIETIKNTNSIPPKNNITNQNGNNIGIDNKKNTNMPAITNLNLSNILNNVQGQIVNNTKDTTTTTNDNFEGVPDEVKERYKNWVENSHIFSGQMIKICKNKKPLSNAYIGGNASKDDISYSNLLQFLWKRNMSTLNVNLNLEVTEELLNSFDFHVLEFIMKSIKNNEDYKTEKFKYPNLALCEELFEEIERKHK